MATASTLKIEYVEVGDTGVSYVEYKWLPDTTEYWASATWEREHEYEDEDEHSLTPALLRAIAEWVDPSLKKDAA